MPFIFGNTEILIIDKVMELQQLETTAEVQDTQPLNSRFLEVIINLNPVLAEDEILLLSYYKQVRSTWSSSAIKNLKEAEGLKLTNKLNRCKFAIAAAKLQLQFVSSGDEEQVTYSTGKSKEFSLDKVPEDNAFSESFAQTDMRGGKKSEGLQQLDYCASPSTKKVLSPSDFSSFDNLSNSSFQADLLESEALQIAQEQIQLLESQLKEKEEQLQQQEEQLKQSENFSFLLLSHRLLAPGLPLNGAENTPAMRVLGSPKTLTELDCNYRELIKREHPDVSPFPKAVAIERFGYLRSLYRITRENWDTLKPTAVISKEQLETLMNAPVPFDINSFW